MTLSIKADIKNIQACCRGMATKARQLNIEVKHTCFVLSCMISISDDQPLFMCVFFFVVPFHFGYCIVYLSVL